MPETDIKTIKLFLASSCELEEDLKEFELFINRKNKSWFKNERLFFELIIWEDFLDHMSQTRMQDEYNKAVRECDLFVMLFFTKVGNYTLEEFETAFGHFRENSRPLIYTYFKSAPIDSDTLNRKDENSLFDFQDKLKELEHFWTKYKNIDDLKHQFGNQLEKLKEEGFFQSDNEAPSTPAPTATPSSGQTPTANQTPRSNVLTSPPTNPEAFFGREKELQAIETNFEQENGVLLLLNGIGGIGKTTVAKAYLQRYAANYDHVGWINYADSIEQSVIEAFALQ